MRAGEVGIIYWRCTVDLVERENAARRLNEAARKSCAGGVDCSASPYLCADLVSALARLQVHDFTHFALKLFPQTTFLHKVNFSEKLNFKL